METPQITVLLSVHNGERWVEKAITSVLEQTFSCFEFIIIDDASTDATVQLLERLRDPRLRLVRNEENLGLTVNLNRGLSMARAEYIARQDADDWSRPDRLATQLSFLQRNPAVAAVGSQAHLVDGQERSLGRKDFPLTHAGVCWMHLFDNALAHSAVTFRKAAVQAIGGYDESYPASQDYDLWSRLSERHRLANLPQRLVTLRVLETSITRKHPNPELIRRVQSAHFSRILPGRQLSRTELDLIGSYRTRFEPQMITAFDQHFVEWRLAYETAFPETRTSSDFRRTVALQHERIGYNLLESDRSSAFRKLCLAVRVWPPRALQLPWMRIVALALLGDSARKVYAKVMGRSSS